MIVDVEHHLFMPEQVLKAPHASGKMVERAWDPVSGKMRSKISPWASDVERHIAYMDAAGIDVSVLTTNFVGGLDQMKRWNDFVAAAQHKYPKRIIGFACVPLTGGDPAMQELDRAINGLGLQGAHMWTHEVGLNVDARELWPFYEKVSKLNVPIDVHVTIEPPGLPFLDAPYGLYYTLGREFDMMAATLRIILGGVLESYPELVFIMGHYGGGVSSIVERLDAYLGYQESGAMASFYVGKPLISKPFKYYWDKLYFNMAGRELGLGSIQCALTNISPDRLLFGSDWPFNYENPALVKQYAEEIKKMALPKGAAAGMLGGNAARLLKI